MEDFEALDFGMPYNDDREARKALAKWRFSERVEEQMLHLGIPWKGPQKPKMERYMLEALIMVNMPPPPPELATINEKWCGCYSIYDMHGLVDMNICDEHGAQPLSHD